MTPCDDYTKQLEFHYAVALCLSYLEKPEKFTINLVALSYKSAL